MFTNQKQVIWSTFGSRIRHLLFLFVTALAFVAYPAFSQEVLDSDSMSKKSGSTTAKGSYKLFQEGDKVKLTLDFSVRKSGVSGTGKGVMAFVLTDADGNNLFKKEKGFTVGADAVRGTAKKEFEQTFSLFGSKAKKLLEEGGGAAFTVQVEKDTTGIPSSPGEWGELLGDTLPVVLGGLGVGNSTDEIAGWVIKRIIK